MAHYSLALNKPAYGYFDYLENKNEYLKIITEEIENIKCRKEIKQSLDDIVDEMGIIKIINNYLYEDFKNIFYKKIEYDIKISNETYKKYLLSLKIDHFLLFEHNEIFFINLINRDALLQNRYILFQDDSREILINYIYENDINYTLYFKDIVDKYNIEDEIKYWDDFIKNIFKLIS